MEHPAEFAMTVDRLIIVGTLISCMHKNNGGGRAGSSNNNCEHGDHGHLQCGYSKNIVTGGMGTERHLQ